VPRYDLRTWERWPAVAWLAASTALRPGELLRLRRRDVDLVRGAVLVAERRDEGELVKTEGAARWVAIGSERCLAVLKEALEGLKPTDLLFPGRTGTACYSSAPLRLKSAATSERAGVPYVTPYGLRHTAATLAASNGASLLGTSSMLRHSRTTTTDEYLHRLTVHGTEAAGAVGAALDRMYAAKPKLEVVKDGGN
jgi:integrase